ncbi:unnamed protein product [Rhizoctonia solani]|uniref:Heme haloperoxidase family profile domain-containing protein n=1 Tax=Rhizoctonia solani TaxID=456999 RepID=A0A8H3AFT1_9AGAM|nr:unnamed protein product [Rhizoctonia solani]
MDSSKPSKTAGCPYTANAARLKRQSDDASLATFDPVKQKVDVTGEHAFRPPTAGDKRGPCPGLNALANHGYLPHNGVTPLLQAIEATNKVFGMGIDLGTVLSIYSTIYGGNPVALGWSIGGSPGGLVLPPLLSAPQGLSGSHNKYEGDASATRADAYLNNGDASSLNITFFKQLYDLQPGESRLSITGPLTKSRIQQRGLMPTLTMILLFNTGSAGAGTPYQRILKNPEGVLDHNTLKSFYGVSGAGNNLTYQKGHERIPDNWYKRGTDYGIPSLLVDILYAGAKHPELLSIGGNTGRANSFAGVNLGNITGGAYNAVNLLEGNNLMCFACQAAQQAMPDVLGGPTRDTTSATELWNSNITPIMSGLSCPNLTKYDGSVFGTFPGSGAGL